MGTRGSKSTDLRGTGPSPGTGDSSGTGSGISYQDFWEPLQRAIAGSGWDLLSSGTNFVLAARKSDWVIGMIDAQANTASQSFDYLDRWAEDKGIARSRLLVAVFSKASKKDIEAITKLQRGTRMLPQAMGAVINLQEGKFYRPDVPGITWHGSKYPLFDEQVGRDIAEALQDVLKPS